MFSIYIKYMEYKISKMQNKINNLKNKIVELNMHIHYMPFARGYLDTYDHYNKMLNIYGKYDTRDALHPKEHDF